MTRVLPALLLGAALAVPAPGDDGGPPARAADDRAVALARSVMEHLGGDEAWEATRYVTWDFFGSRRHVWDRWTGDVRIEVDGRVILMNIDTRRGRVFEGDAEVTDEAARAEALEGGYAMWVNDSYWMFMPYKLLDPGVRLAHRGEGALADGRAADVLELTFDDGVGLTPRNRYDVFVARDTGLVEQWSFYRDADDAEPRFTGPWAGWKRFGRIMLSTDKGRGKDWRVAVFDDLPRSVFDSPAPLAF